MSDIPQRLCTGTCGRILPATEEFFYVHIRRDRGKPEMTARCKSCFNKAGSVSKKRRRKESLSHASNGHTPVSASIDKLTVFKPIGTSERCGSCGTTQGNIFGDVVDATTGEKCGWLCMKCYKLVRDFGGDPKRMRKVLEYVEKTRPIRVAHKKMPATTQA